MYMNMKTYLSLTPSGFLLLAVSQNIAAADVEGMDYGQLSCHQLYAIATLLELKTQDYSSLIFNKKTDVLASPLGSITKIGYYYFGLSLRQGYYIRKDDYIDLSLSYNF
jgi:hypothetical protein